MQPKLARMLARMFDGMLSSAFLATRGLGATTGKGPDFPNKSALDAAIDAARTLARLRMLVNAPHPGLCPFRWTATELACCLWQQRAVLTCRIFVRLMYWSLPTAFCAHMARSQ